jgi:hypothetical protein
MVAVGAFIPDSVSWLFAATCLGLSAGFVVLGSRRWSESCRIGRGRSGKIRYVGEGFVTVEFGDHLVDLVPRAELRSSRLLRRHVTVLGLPRAALIRDPYQRRGPIESEVHLGSPARNAGILRAEALRALLWSLPSAVAVMTIVLA